MKRVAVVVALALVASGCTAQPLRRDRAVSVAPAKGGVIVSIASARGGLTQWELDDSARILSASVARTPAAAPTEDCAGQFCYRLIAPYRVEESRDGGVSYGLSYEVGGADYPALATSLGGAPEVVGLTVKPVTGGHVVFVAAGLDGVLYRARDGQWRRMGVPRGGEGYYWEPTARLASQPAPPDRGPVVGLAAFVLIAVVGLLALLIRGALRTRRLSWIMGLAVAAGGLSWLSVYFPDAGMFSGTLLAAGSISLIITTALAAIVLIAWTARPIRRGMIPWCVR